jgi:hypothetical protein
MICEFILQFALELIRTLFVEELSRRVRLLRRECPTHQTLAAVHRRNRDRLLNRLLTDLEDPA